MKYAIAVLSFVLAAPAVAQTPQQEQKPLFWNSKDGQVRPSKGLDGLYREPYTGGGALDRGPYTGGGQLYDLTPAADPRSSGSTDWSKPVTGVDTGALGAAATVEEVTLPIAISAQDQTAKHAPDDTPLPPPCEPPVTKTQAAKPPPAPCPLPPR